MGYIIIKTKEKNKITIKKQKLKKGGLYEIKNIKF